MSQTIFKNLGEALDYCFSDEIEADITLLPPEVDDLTDEDEDPDCEIGPPKIVDVPRTTKIIENDSEDDEELEQTVEESCANKEHPRSDCSNLLKIGTRGEGCKRKIHFQIVNFKNLSVNRYAPKERSHLGTNLVTEVAKLLAQIFQSNVPQKFHLNNVLSWQWNVGELHPFGTRHR
ncbi:hypothetical protein GEV33_004152 [Tenebrio molitor]|uniref:Uncharacterized protein n=1 Tax=Tenebrio molitor TaxID=7067 RepID=A0A8J6HQV6_TENMO|nr:hypothetical protein GEV33_004152 [Tenebrio molitor]